MHQYTKDIKEFFGYDIPLSGGLGQSKKEAVIIDVKKFDHPVSVASLESTILNFVSSMRGVGYEMIEQVLISVGNKKLDRIIIVWDDDKDNERAFYFDVSSSFKR